MTASAARRAPTTQRSAWLAAAARPRHQSRRALHHDGGQCRGTAVRCSIWSSARAFTNSICRISSMPAAATRTAATTRLWQTTRDAMDMVIDRAWALGAEPAARWKSSPATTTPTRSICCTGPSATVPQRGGASARASSRSGAAIRPGVNIANIDNLGNVHPDTMWWHYKLGNVKDAAVLGDLDRPVRSDHGGAEAQAARDRRALRRSAPTSTSAAATPGCAPCASPAIPGPKIPVAI